MQQLANIAMKQWVDLFWFLAIFYLKFALNNEHALSCIMYHLLIY